MIPGETLRDPRDPRAVNIPVISGDRRDSRDQGYSTTTVISGKTNEPTDSDPWDIYIPAVPGDHRGGDHRDHRDPRNTPPHNFFTDKKKGAFLPPICHTAVILV